MSTPENYGKQFNDLVAANFDKCPACNRNYITADSPISRVDNKTQICTRCKGGELTREQIINTDPVSLLKTDGSVEDLIESRGPALAFERLHKQALSEESFHAERVKNSSIPIPEETQIRKWRVSYGRNQHTGEIEAYAHAPEDHPSSWYAHDACFDIPSGKVMFGVRGTQFPPEYVQNHIIGVLKKHHRKYGEGK